MPQQVLDMVGALAPTIGVIATGAFGYMASRSNNLSKSQFNEIKTGLDEQRESINQLNATADSNNEVLKNVQSKLDLHDEAHLSTMYLRLERDIKHALERGNTTSEEYKLIGRMHKNYKALGGNGYIDKLIEQYEQLKMEE
ncbi:hypothetical protein [Streptococcus hillyeri]|uniref:Uncharacterized protein n=1 Tax=Streptococcus hillyeri TaxID=2282420 RepID=A0A3L9DSX3_9STRE|nr:hypothetical protein [Streptococcus hillyeri]RLY02232.1 hypothetical protein EAF07_08275 [Streptococcus hillyeri]